MVLPLASMERRETGIRKSEAHWLASPVPSVVHDEIPS